MVTSQKLPMSTRNLPRHDLKLFHWEKGTNQLTIEVSSLRGNLYGPIYHDACDVGFKLVSPTDRAVIFYLDSVKEKDQEIQFWVFKLMNDADKDQPIREVVIFND